MRLLLCQRYEPDDCAARVEALEPAGLGEVLPVFGDALDVERECFGCSTDCLVQSIPCRDAPGKVGELDPERALRVLPDQRDVPAPRVRRGVSKDVAVPVELEREAVVLAVHSIEQLARDVVAGFWLLRFGHGVVV